VNRCRTIGCKSQAVDTVVWTDGSNVLEPVCRDCADSYLRRPALRNSIYVDRSRVSVTQEEIATCDHCGSSQCDGAWIEDEWAVSVIETRMGYWIATLPNGDSATGETRDEAIENVRYVS
jgi:hypothetical protein